VLQWRWPAAQPEAFGQHVLFGSFLDKQKGISKKRRDVDDYQHDSHRHYDSNHSFFISFPRFCFSCQVDSSCFLVLAIRLWRIETKGGAKSSRNF
jgi:hypothetical protein